MLKHARTVLILLVAIAMAVLAVRHSLANAARTRNPALAAQLAPHDGMVLDRLVELQLTEAIAKQETKFTAQTIERANRAIRSEPFAISSLTTLALAAKGAGDDDLAKTLFGHASSLSRRELRLELLLIEQHAKSMRLAPLMKEMDGTLRVFQSSYPTIFPLLTQLLNVPEMQPHLLQIAREDPPWFRLFIGHALTSQNALPAVRKLLTALPESAAATAPDIRRNLVAQLAASGRTDEAREYFLTLHPNEAEKPIIDPGFDHPDYEAPFGWMVGGDPDLTANFTLDEGLGLYAGRGREGLAARQVTKIEPGSHMITLNGEKQSLEQIYIEFQCIGPGKAQVVERKREGTFTVTLPSGCAQQVLGIGLRESRQISGTTAYIRSISIAPLGR